MDLLLTILTQRGPILALLGGGVAILGAIRVFGMPAVVKVLLDARTWLAVVILCGILAIGDLKRQNEALKKSLAAQQQETTALTDAQKTTDLRLEQITKRASETKTIADARKKAKPDEQVDTAMDAIAGL